MKELTFSKELLPLFDTRPVIQHSLDALRRTTSDIIAVVNPNKKDLIRYLKSQNVAIIKALTKGPVETLQIGAQKARQPILFALTDTYYQPEDVFVRLAEQPEPNVVALFDSPTPERFDSVVVKGTVVTHYAVKVTPPLSRWTMGCGKLSPAAFVHTDPSGEIIFGNLFIPLTQKRQLHAIKLKASRFFDLGTPEYYIEYLLHRFPPTPKLS